MVTNWRTYNDDGFPDISLYFYDDNHTRLMHSFRVDLKNSRRVLISDNGTRYWQDTIQHRSLLRSVWGPESEEYEFKRIEFLPDTVCRLSVPIGVLWDKSPIMGSYNDTNYPYVLIYIPEEETGRPDEKRKLLFASDDLSVTVTEVVMHGEHCTKRYTASKGLLLNWNRLIAFDILPHIRQ